jgi:hypothetical protein
VQCVVAAADVPQGRWNLSVQGDNDALLESRAAHSHSNVVAGDIDATSATVLTGCHSLIIGTSNACAHHEFNFPTPLSPSNVLQLKTE